MTAEALIQATRPLHMAAFINELDGFGSPNVPCFVQAAGREVALTHDGQQLTVGAAADLLRSLHAKRTAAVR